MYKALISILAVISSLAATAQAEVIATQNLSRGKILTKVDLTSKTNIAEDFALIDEKLVGMELRRMVYQNQPVRVQDVIPVQLVKRNNLVQVMYSFGGLQIKTQGRALDAGGKGDVVSVMNLSSRQTIYGQVIGPNLIRIN